MTIPRHPNDLIVKHPATQECLDYALMIGRQRGGHDSFGLKSITKIPPPTTMRQVTFQHAQRVLAKHHGHGTNAASELGIQRCTLYRILQNAGRNPVPKSSKIVALTQVAALLVAVCLIGCTTSKPVAVIERPPQMVHSPAAIQVSAPMPPVPMPEVAAMRSSMVSAMEARSTAMAVVAPMPKLPQLTLAWSSVADIEKKGYRIYYGDKSGNYTNSVFTATNRVSFFDLPAGQTYYAAAVTVGETESLFSNEVRFYVAKGLRVENLVLEVYETLGGQKVSESKLLTYTNSIPGVSQKYLRLRQDLVRLE